MQEGQDVPDRSPNDGTQDDHRIGNAEPSGDMSGLLEDATDWLLRLRSAPEDAALQSEFTRWLTMSEAHGRAFARVERVWSLGGAVSPAFEQIWSTSAQERSSTGESGAVTFLKPRRKAVARRPFIASAIAAGIALLLLTVGPQMQIIFSGAELTSGTAEVARYDLSDGSQVILNAGSALATDLSGPERRVTLLAGEAFFEVHPDPARPFQVHAGNTLVTVTGTEFGTRLSGSGTVVEVEGGTVSVSPAASDHRDADLLKHGDRLSTDRYGARTIRVSIPASHIAPWRRGLLIADNERVEDVVDRIRPYYSGTIFVAPGGIADKRVSGVFNLDRPGEALRAVVQPHGGSVYEVPSILAILTPS